MKNTKLLIGIGFLVLAAGAAAIAFRKDIANMFRKKGVVNEDNNVIRETPSQDGKRVNVNPAKRGDKVAILAENGGFWKVEVISENNKGTIGYMYKSKINLS